jgi:hypothetical protein
MVTLGTSSLFFVGFIEPIRKPAPLSCLRGERSGVEGGAGKFFVRIFIVGNGYRIEQLIPRNFSEFFNLTIHRL